ncbi:hypothetical protein DK926_05055 [Rhodococcus sp. Eu-32]|uniref:hypothetical protein n=1 Tax=Rhodococcus sp. Eu-32 TaxID=1017319 RepID=UPI000DF3F5B9|nr:hypothetical protein [Rhodococcus sp. Eu-32]RRQ29252.1 hypothetical protein DK926_05055 [Rhodococcus sp. Eu-32]
MVFDYVQQTFFEPEVMYNGVYQSLHSTVQVASAYDRSVGLHTEPLEGVFSRWRRWAVPTAGAAIGAVVGMVLHRLGFRLTRPTDG